MRAINSTSLAPSTGCRLCGRAFICMSPNLLTKQSWRWSSAPWVAIHRAMRWPQASWRAVRNYKWA